MIRQLAVDFNRVVEGSMIRTNASRAVTRTELEVGQTIVVGDDIWELSGRSGRARSSVGVDGVAPDG